MAETPSAGQATLFPSFWQIIECRTCTHVLPRIGDATGGVSERIEQSESYLARYPYRLRQRFGDNPVQLLNARENTGGSA